MTQQEKKPKHLLISADHGMALVYFLQSDLVPALLAQGVRITLLTDDEIVEVLQQKYPLPGLRIRGLRQKELADYARSFHPRWQWVLAYLRRVGGSRRINTQAMDSHRREVWAENSWKFRLGIWLPCELAVFLLKRSRLARRSLVRLQERFTGDFYTDLLQDDCPDLVVASSPGWRMDRYLLREARRAGIPSMAAVIGWDNPSSYAVPGARVDYATCWSQVQKDELVLGSDWDPARVFVGGMPTYDGYFQGKWRMPREEFFRLHGLDPQRKLVSYACSFVHFAPNLPNIQALVDLVAGGEMATPAQLLIRLHPSHFQDKPVIFAEERRRIQELEMEYPHVHVVRPVPLGGSLGYYSGEDMPEKSSMMALSDVFVTVYSTMVVECAIHRTPIVSACIDTPGGWNQKGKFSLSLKEIGSWPTHERFRQSGIGRTATDPTGLRDAVSAALQSKNADPGAVNGFIDREVTFQDGKAGLRTAEIILGLLDNGAGGRPAGRRQP